MAALWLAVATLWLAVAALWLAAAALPWRTAHVLTSSNLYSALHVT